VVHHYRPDLPVVLMSSYSSAILRQDALAEALDRRLITLDQEILGRSSGVIRAGVTRAFARITME
jgi:hypothetical protein